MFEKWTLQEEPLRLIITEININMLVNLSKFKQEHTAGSTLKETTVPIVRCKLLAKSFLKIFFFLIQLLNY